jgi:hypothetical protein
MVRQKITLVLAGFATGGLIMLLVHRSGGLEEIDRRANPPAPVADDPAAAAPRAGPIQQTLASPGNVGALQPEEIRAQSDSGSSASESVERRRADATQVTTQRLLGAGFSQARIESLRRRRDELQWQMEQADLYRKRQGMPENPLSFAAIRDKDLLLRNEMAEDEYIRYRQAIGKTTAINVRTVLPGSHADQAGIKPGDQIVRYGGRRVVDSLELDALAISDASTGPVMVEVLRNGQMIWIALRNGPAGFRASTLPP